MACTHLPSLYETIKAIETLDINLHINKIVNKSKELHDSCLVSNSIDVKTCFADEVLVGPRSVQIPEPNRSVGGSCSKVASQKNTLS